MTSGGPAPVVHRQRTGPGPELPAGRPRRPSWPGGTGRRRPSGRDRLLPRRVPAAVWAWSAVVAAAVVLLVLADRPGGLLGLDRVLPGTGPPDPGTAAADLARVGTVLGYRALWLPPALVLVWTARWRHLLVHLGTVSVMAAVAQLAAGEGVLVRAVRAGVTGTPAAVEFSAWPDVVLATVAVTGLYVLTPSGRARRWGWVAVAALLTAVVVPRVSLGLDSPSTAVAAVLLGVGTGALACTVLAPEDAFPVTWHRRVAAHLTLDGARTTRIRGAVLEQLGTEVAAVEPFRLAGSAGSTPCRLVRPDGPPLFGKLYSTTHLRSDRWYKVLRVLRWGRLEDEAPFSSVRRLVEHEDYMLRLLRDGGVRVPGPLGVVEVVPGREYLLVTELVPRTVELRRSRMGDAVVDDALRQVRLLWSAGAAHRDLKPSNLLVQDEARVVVIDVSFGELRPSRWRQAADLGAVLLCCALVAGPERVLERARRQFSDEELAEAVAAVSPLTLPTQLRRMLVADGRDLVGRLRDLLPPHPPIRVQRWSARRVLLALGTVGGAALTLVLVVLNLRAGGLL